MSSPTRIADDAAAIAQAMKDLGLEKSVPAEPKEVPGPRFVDGDVRMTENGWQIHDDDWLGPVALALIADPRLMKLLKEANDAMLALAWSF